jgi:uncharacterized delta-60 repeat protein
MDARFSHVPRTKRRTPTPVSTRACPPGVLPASYLAEQLEPRTLLNAVSWIGSTSGDFDNPTNWSTAQVPSPGDDVTINVAPSITVTHGTTATDTVHSLISDNPFILSAGFLSVTTTLQLGSSFTLSGGTLQGATISNAGNLLLTPAGGGLDAVTLGNDITVPGGAFVQVFNGLGLGSNTLHIGTTGPAGGQVLFTGAQTLSSGTISFEGPSSDTAIVASDSTLTLGPAATVVATNTSQFGAVNAGQITNQGTIAVSGAGNALTVAGFFTNQGALIASNGGKLSISGDYNASGGGTINIGIGSGGAGDFDVTGIATLGGALNINLLNGFIPPQGNSNNVVTYGSETGAFATINGLSPAGVLLTPTLGTTALTLFVTTGALPPPPVPPPPPPQPPLEHIGGLDPGYGNAGLGSHNVGFNSIGSQVSTADNESIIVGPIGSAGSEAFGVTRYDANGGLDTTFGNNGVATTAFPGADARPVAISLQSDGSIIVAGTATTASGSEFALAAYNADGSPDTSFGNGTGKDLTSFSTTAGTLSTDAAKAMVIRPNGQIVVAGSSNAAGNGLDFALAEYNADGTLATFGNGGMALLDYSGGDDAIDGIALQTNGDVVAAGYTTNPASGIEAIALARFLPTGVLDTHFGSKGRVVTTVRGVFDQASSAAVDSQGKIVVGGLTASGSASDGSLSGDFVILRYTPAGAIDRSFGGGPVITSFGQPSAVSSVLTDSDGTVVATGRTTETLAGLTNSNLDLAVAKYTARGALDTTFNGTGTAIIDINGGAGTAPAVLVKASSNLDAPMVGTFAVTPFDAASDLMQQFQNFDQSSQGVVASVQGGELLVAGSSGSNTVEAAVIAAAVDLVTHLVSTLPASVVGGAKGTATVQVNESGSDVASGVVTIQLFASPDAALDSGLTPFGTFPESIKLKTGQARTFKLKYAFPAGVADGDYFLVANIDTGSIQQLNAVDTVAASASPVRIAAPFVDLAGSGLTPVGSVLPGKPGTVSFSITDNGNVPAKATVPVELLASVDGTVGNGIMLASPALALNLPVGATRNFHEKFTMPTLSSGSYFLVAVVDPSNTLNDPNFGNNVIVSTAMVVVS